MHHRDFRQTFLRTRRVVLYTILDYTQLPHSLNDIDFQIQKVLTELFHLISRMTIVACWLSSENQQGSVK